MKLMFAGCRGLVLGANCEIGICLSQYLIHAGLFPVLTGRNQERIRELASGLAEYSGKFRTLALDFGQSLSYPDLFFDQIGFAPEFVVDLIQSDLERLIGSASDDEITTYFNQSVIFRAAFLKRAVRIMLKHRKGRFVHVSSSAAVRANPGQGFYAAAKLASEAMYRNIGIEMGRRGITTVSLRLGYVEAGRGKTYIRENAEAVKKLVPLGKPLNPQQVAETIMFLLSDSAAGFNATEITMDGGMTAAK